MSFLVVRANHLPGPFISPKRTPMVKSGSGTYGQKRKRRGDGPDPCHISWLAPKLGGAPLNEPKKGYRVPSKRHTHLLVAGSVGRSGVPFSCVLDRTWMNRTWTPPTRKRMGAPFVEKAPLLGCQFNLGASLAFLSNYPMI